MHARASRTAWSEFEWRDRVAESDEDLDQDVDVDVDGLIADMKDMARTVAECTIEPLRAFAQSLPRAFAFESQQWDDARRWSSRNKAWRYARRRWRL